MGVNLLKPMEYNPDGPLMSCLKEPQLMHVKWRDKSSFMRNKDSNRDMHLVFKTSHKNRGIPQCCGRFVKEKS